MRYHADEMRPMLDGARFSQDSRMQRHAETAARQGAEGSHPASRTLVQRPRLSETGSRRFREFLRIARGHRA